MPRPLPSCLTIAALLLAVCPAVRGQGTKSDPFQAADERYQARILPLLQKYCHGCHGAEKPKSGLDLAAFTDARKVAEGRDRWEVALDYLHDGEMPPPDFQPQPSKEETDEIAGWIESTLSQLDCDLVNPGRVTLRRLNRAEYDRTIRDLTGVDFHPSADFPADDVGYGFDNIGDVLSLDPLLLEKYLAASEEIARRAIDSAGPTVIPSKLWRDSTLRDAGGEPNRRGRFLGTEGEIAVEHDFPYSGRYTLRIRALGEQAGDEPVRMAVKLDGQVVREFPVENSDRHRPFEAVTQIDAGHHRIAVAFLNNFKDPENDDPNRRDRNLIIDEVQAIGPGDPVTTYEAERLPDEAGGSRTDDGRGLASDGKVLVQHEAAGPGEYRVRVRAYGDQAGPDPVRMAVEVDGQAIEVFDVRATSGDPGEYEVRVRLDAGPRTFAFAFLNDYYMPDNADERLRGDRNLWIDRVSVAGPIHDYYTRVPRLHREILADAPLLTSDLPGTTRHALRRFADRAYRRPATDAEVDRLCALAEMVRRDGGSPEESLRLAIQAALVSPSFLYRVEFGGSPDPNGPSAVEPLGPYELASRLSYFLWGSMPDDQLLEAAKNGSISTPEGLEAQTRRLLADPKSRSLVDDFAGQWLQFRNLDQVSPDNGTFPRFSERLRKAMRTETEMFVESIIREDRNVLDLLDANYTFVNERLARHYGIQGVEGEDFRRIDLKPEDHRGGLLTQASVLTITSNPTRTSPVKRGKWILEQVLGTPPPPAPPDVPPLPESGDELKGTLRERMIQHRANPGCASCHERMDPLGFGFENYDAVGAWREKDADQPIDASGNLPSGESFNGPAELRALLKGRSQDFTHCLTEKLMTFALGRGLEYFDKCTVDQIVAKVPAEEAKFSRLILEIVQSNPFRFRTAEGSE